MWIWNPHHKKNVCGWYKCKSWKESPGTFLVLSYLKVDCLCLSLFGFSLCFVCGAVKTVNALEQRSANYGPQASSGPPPDFVLCFQMGGIERGIIVLWHMKNIWNSNFTWPFHLGHRWKPGRKQKRASVKCQCSTLEKISEVYYCFLFFFVNKNLPLIHRLYTFIMER